MDTPLLELDGTAEEIQERLADFAGQRLHVTISPLPTERETSPETPPRKHSISETLLAMADEMPLDEQAKMPTDLAEQHDHYVYGWPKK